MTTDLSCQAAYDSSVQYRGGRAWPHRANALWGELFWVGAQEAIAVTAPVN
jgi:hypothetical protein